MTGVEVAAAAVAAGAAVAGTAIAIGKFIIGGSGHVDLTGTNPCATNDMNSAQWKEWADAGVVKAGEVSGRRMVCTFTKHMGWGKGATWNHTENATPKGGWGDGKIRARIPLNIYYEVYWVLMKPEKKGQSARYFPHIQGLVIETRGGSRGVDSFKNALNEPGVLAFQATKRLDGTTPYINVAWELKLDGRPWATGLQRTGDFQLAPEAAGDDIALRMTNQSDYTRNYLHVARMQ